MAFAGGLLAGLAGLAEAPRAYQEGRRKAQEIETGDLNIEGLKSDKLAMAALGSVVGQGEQIAGLGGGGLGSAVPQSFGPPGQMSMPQNGMAMRPPPSLSLAQPPQAQPPAPGAASQSGGQGVPPSAVPQQQPQFPPGGTTQGIPTGAAMGMPGGPGVAPVSQQPGMAQFGAMSPRPGGPPPGPPSGAPQTPGAGPLGGGNKPQPFSFSPGQGQQPPPQQQGHQGGGLNLNQLAQMIRQQNPNLPPEAMFKALKYGSQLLTPMANMELKNLALELRMQDMDRKYSQFVEGEKNKGTRQAEAEGFRASEGDKNRGFKTEQADKKTEKAEDETSEIVKSIVSGRQPPVTTGLYGKGPAVKAGLEKAGFDMGKAQLEWQGAQRQVASLNGPQMTRFNVLASTVDNTIEHVKDLAEQMKLKNIPLLNQIELQAYIQAQGDTPNSKLAVQYMTAVNGLKEEFANLANGGYAPTAPAWKLANEQINGNYSVGKLSASLEEVQRLIRYRMQALQARGSGGANRYESGGGQQGGGGSQGAAPSDKPKTVIQNGHTYELQPDGSYK